MMSRFFRTIVCSIVLCMAAGPVAAQTPVPTIDALTSGFNSNTITVEGLATIPEESATTVGTDPAGDAALNPSFGLPSTPLTGVGMDLTSAKISRASTGMLTFTLDIADPMDNTFTIPELVGYHWLIKVTNGDQSIYYQLQAMRTGQYERTLPNNAPLFRVNSCDKLASGAPNCFEVAGHVDGVMDGGIVQWQVPAPLIGAFNGAVIEQSGTGQVRSIFSASGAAYVGNHGDTIETVPYVVGPVVQIGTRRATADPASTVYKNASLGPDGTFTGKIAMPKSSGKYVLVVRACGGAVAGCAVQTIPYEF